MHQLVAFSPQNFFVQTYTMYQRYLEVSEYSILCKEDDGTFHLTVIPLRLHLQDIRGVSEKVQHCVQPCRAGTVSTQSRCEQSPIHSGLHETLSNLEVGEKDF